MSSLKPFIINQTDIQFILDQLNFVPLFDSAGDVIIDWDGTGKVFSSSGSLLATGGSIAGDQASRDAIALVGSSYQNVTDLAGTRDVSGIWNNLTPALKNYGDTGSIFPRMAAANFSNYLHQSTAMSPAARPVPGDLGAVIGTVASIATSIDGAVTANQVTLPYPGGSYSFSYDTWTRSTTTQQVTTRFIDGGHIFANLTQIDTVTTTQSDFMVGDTSGEHIAVAGVPSSPVTTIGTPVISGGELDGQYHHFSNSVAATAEAQTDYALAHQSYAVTAAVVGATEGNTLASDGTAINIQNVIDYTPRMISRTTTTAGVTYDTWADHQGDTAAGHHTPNEIYYGATGEATVLDWGVLETVANGGEGQVDTQARLAASAGQGDHFIGSLNPGVSPSNGFFVLFGQFFDHGLDFVDKSQTDASGKAVTIKIALAVDDPLYGMLGSDGRPVTQITINRATVQTLDAKGTEYVNHVSPFIDQSQTYGSDAQRTQLLREWVPDASTPTQGDFHAGMKLLDGTTLATSWTRPDGTPTYDTLPTLNELRAHIAATGRSDLTWEDIGNLRARDEHGIVVDTNGPAAGGVVQTGEALLLDMNPRFDAAHLFSGNADQDLQVGNAIAYLNSYGVRPGDSFAMINDVLTLTLGSAMSMGPGQPALPAGLVLTGASALAGWVDFSTFGIMQSPPGIPAQFIEGVRDAVSHILVASVGDHYIAGDGRVNENFGLTSIHHVFHEEHNFQVENLIDALHRQDVATSDVTHEKLHEFQVATGTMNASGDYIYTDGSIAWNEEKVFQGAKLIVEMEYQHAAVDQYARNVSPNIQEFVGYSPDKNPDVSMEYSQVAFRFGHSTLRETIDTIDPSHGITGKIMGYALHDAFLAPEMYSAVGPSAILLGMTHQQQNEVDEFVTPALNQGLLGQPLDLAAINIARGRDMGMPTLNDFREAVGLVRYTSWTDFGQNMQHPSSLANFIAAYSFDGDLAKADAILGLADGSLAADTTEAMGYTVAQAIAFLSGDAAIGGTGTLGFNQIDTWLGGLAEIHQPGGLLGETFDLVFVTQIEALMDGDRFYYLYRLAGQQFGEEVANAQLKDIVERNSGLLHLNGNVFGYADQYVDLGAQKEVAVAGIEALTTGNEHKYGDIGAVAAGTIGVYSNGGLGNANDGHTVAIGGKVYIQDTRLSADNPGSELYDATGHSAYAQNGFVNLDGTPNSGAESNEVIVGTRGDDLIYAQGGDDTVYGEDGNDIIFGGFGIDRLYGGAGSDTIKGGDNPDLIDGGAGDDFLYGESSGSDINGADQIIGGSGNDLLDGGVGIDKLSAGSGDDRVYGGQDTDPFTHGGDGNDYVDGQSGGDILYGDNGDDVVVGGADQDQLFGDDGDDILRPGDPTGALTIGGDEVLGGDGSDVNDTGFDLIDFSDNTGRPGGVTFDLSNQQNPATTPNGSSVQVQSFQIDGIVGSKSDDTLVGDEATAAGAGSDASIAGNNWLIGGSGNDTVTGGGGNDIIVGGSIRLDALIGKYNTTYDHNTNNHGTTAADQLQDALYQGASHRVLYSETIDDSGLLGHAETAVFEKHFTEMLRTEMFKNTVLGDGGADGTADTAIYSGNLASYTLVALDAQGGVVEFPHRDGFFALKIVDNRTPADLIDANGNPTVDANGNLITLDGTDLVIGVEKIQFADQTINPQAYFDIAPTLDLNYVSAVRNTLDAFGASINAYGQNNGTIAWNGSWQEGNDGGGINGGSASGQITRSTLSNGVLQFGSGDGAEITRGVGQNGATPTSIVFDLQAKNGIGVGETLALQYSADGTHFVTLATYGSADTTGAKTISLSGQAMTANSEIRFAVSALGTADYFRVDNVRVNFATDTVPGNNNTASYTERSGAGAALTTAPLITDADDVNLASARIVLTDAIVGDQLNVGGLAGLGITASGNGTGAGGLVGATTINLSGSANAAAYQTALKAITYTNPTNHNPTVYNTDTTRHIDVTVNDGLKDSAVATTTVTITAVNEATIAANDTIITNAGSATFAVPDAALLANDVDPDTILAISGTSNNAGVTSAHQNGVVTVSDTNGTNASSFHYAVNGQSPMVTVLQQTGTTLTGTANGDILVSGATNDTINAGNGNDFIVWNAAGTVTRNANGTYTNAVTTAGHDTVNGGAGTDSFILNSTVTGVGQGNANTQLATARPDVSETFRIYSNTDDWDGAGPGTGSSAAHAGIASTAEIVITRNGSVVAELNSIEEIIINTGPGVDLVAAVGNFSGTNLAYSTITINDADGGDAVDISGLASDHRIVFNTDASGHVVGDLRPQDVVNGKGGASGSSNPGGVNVATGDDEEEEEEENRAPINSASVTLSPLAMNTSLAITAAMLLANSSDADADPLSVTNLTVSSGAVSSDGDGHWTFTPDSADTSNVTFSYDLADGLHAVAQTASLDLVATPTPDAGGANGSPDAVHAGTDAADVMLGGSGDEVFSGLGGDDLILGGGGADTLMGGGGDDLIKGGDGNDVILGGAGEDDLFGGAGHDMIFGDAGNDRIFGDDGNDVIEGGKGNDTVYAGTGDDRIIATVGDGDDVYWGESGQDTLDYAAIYADLRIDLGNGLLQHGSVSSAESGQDTVFGFENVIAGSGNDTIIASAAVNVIDGGAGNDNFVFRSGADAKGDSIVGFQPGDKIDLSGIDANTSTAGHQSFVLFAGTGFTAAGQVMVTHTVVDGAEHTLVAGNTTSGSGADFQIDLTGHHVLTPSDFNGVA